MSPDDAMNRLNSLFAHAWMVRTFLKHAEEIQEDPEFLDVPRAIFDCVRALEPSFQRQDSKEYLRRASGKLPRLRRCADFLSREFRRVSDHTNFQMAAASLNDCIRQIDEVLGSVSTQTAAPAVQAHSKWNDRAESCGAPLTPTQLPLGDERKDVGNSLQGDEAT